jgi:hypothetical protein
VDWLRENDAKCVFAEFRKKDLGHNPYGAARRLLFYPMMTA